MSVLISFKNPENAKQKGSSARAFSSVQTSLIFYIKSLIISFHELYVIVAENIFQFHRQLNRRLHPIGSVRKINIFLAFVLNAQLYGCIARMLKQYRIQNVCRIGELTFCQLYVKNRFSFLCERSYSVCYQLYALAVLE